MRINVFVNTSKAYYSTEIDYRRQIKEAKCVEMLI